ncbi:flap endonuclease GEN homolog 1 [Clonorchis sinensis]|uniref:Flap endonuclease GEN homolog 1 n=1 Tax=Clonorchis sinensis TaxID=79923 RepID=H2KPB6_CLOSI|nr:flap endonuclease GEN homolog 1 [Clonorchis sinensis]
MGVRGLWSILAPIQEHRPLAELGGETVAVDLSIWTCGDVSVKHNMSVSTKLYLRNLFFRTLNLLRQNTLPVVVLDGVAPSLKATTIANRLCTQRRNIELSIDPAVLVKRRRLSKISGECRTLLQALGVPCVQSPGEAEAMCALLNSSKRVDACITNDGDAFLYGATTVYRHFTMNSRDPSVYVYRSSRIYKELSLDRFLLVFLSIVLGCDYWPTGTVGIGQAGIQRLVSSLRCLTSEKLRDLLNWIKTGRQVSQTEVVEAHSFLRNLDPKLLRLWTKIIDTFQQCPVDEILAEFLANAEERMWSLPSSEFVSTWLRPNPRALVAFCSTHLDWDPDYSLHHLLPVLAMWDMRHPRLGALIPMAHSIDDAVTLIPRKIVKRRTVNFIPCFEVEWNRMGFDCWTRKAGLSGRFVNLAQSGNKEQQEKQNMELTEVYTFPVPAVEFQQSYPNLVERFNSESTKVLRNKPIKVTSRSDPTASDQASLTDLFRRLNLITKPLETKPPPVWDSSSEAEDEFQSAMGTPPPSPDKSSSDQAVAVHLAHAFHLPSSHRNLRTEFDYPNYELNLQSSLLSTTLSFSPKSLRGPSQSMSPSTHDSFSFFQTPECLRDRLTKIE